ncbi:hypothetical protein AB0E04_41250 [Streptomyces sp. NPDC048251]|uniref:hypothetical protein n=1 Tax=Streptomyces sp. NPDC048251 TaxID=3154501 RepID=UPI00343CA6EB
MSGMNWGDVPTWVAAIFAGGVALFAYQTIRSQQEQIGEQRVFIGEQSATLALEREALRAAAEDRKWEQARHVIVSHDRLGGAGVRWLVDVSNVSNSPITDVRLRFGQVVGAQEVYWGARLERHPG